MEIIFGRWLHLLSGVMWIGLLYYFNFVQVAALKAAAEDGTGAGFESPDSAGLCGRWAEHGSGYQAGAGPADHRQVAPAFYGAARVRAA